jgi:hypothetical protein
MRSSHLPDEVQEIARALSPQPVTGISELRRGSNSRIFRVDTLEAPMALKRYPAADRRNRLEAEVRAMRYFERHAIERTPRVIAVAPESQFALFTWIEGRAVTAVSDSDVAQFADFQIAVDRAIDEAARRQIGEASEACLSGARIVSHIEGRFARLAAIKQDFPGFAGFFDEALVPSLHEFEARARKAYRRLGLPFSEEIAVDFRTLIPSDLGAHNALRGADGRLCFLDFEYFGWDDPVTSVANFNMHPGMRLTQRQQHIYRDLLLRHFCRHRERERLAALMPLYALRWCAIILGELLPERWKHRQDNNVALGNWDEVRRQQIAKARTLLSRVTAEASRDR